MAHQDQQAPEVAAAEDAAAGSTSSGTGETAQGAVPPADGVHEVTEPAAPEEEAAAVEADLDELREKAAQRDEYLAIAQRTQADFENYRKRMTREVGLAENRGVTRLAKELLPALDNLDRAIAAAPPGQDSVTEGFRLVHAELTTALARLGIEGYAPKGEPFDPNQHEAMAQHQVDGAESGTVVEVYQPGYRLNDTILRPARVVVAA
jgi:molecular chaperone GrpE